MILALLTLACVPKKDFDAVTADLASERASHATDNEGWKTTKGQLADEEAALAAAKAEEARLSGELDGAKKALADEQSAWASEKAGLMADRSKLKASVSEMEGALCEAAERRAAAEARVKEFKDLLSRFQKLIDAGQLKVKIVDGRMVVVLATDILFASGKADLSDAGKTAIGEVGKVLATIGERNFQVEGHTDNVPIQTDKFPSNWELASARAIIVVKTLTGAGVPATRVSAASFAETHPVADNAAPEGRASNRRIEIVLVPDLSQLPGFEELSKVK